MLRAFDFYANTGSIGKYIEFFDSNPYTFYSLVGKYSCGDLFRKCFDQVDMTRIDDCTDTIDDFFIANDVG